MTAPSLVLATRNPGKVREFQRLLGDHVNLVSLDDVGYDGPLPEETDDYTANACSKAETVMHATGRDCIADDSGIEVIAMQGWPGPASARWLGADAGDSDRLHGLIREVDERTPDDRRVQYVCVIALARPGTATRTVEGRCTGTLAEPRGEGGFGYDPSFLSDDLGLTFGEAPQDDKDGVSHRGRAARELLKLL